MALRSGYYGLKGSVKKALEKLAGDTAGMKVIKSFGDGLNLTSAGKLNMTAASTSKIGGVKVGSGLSIVDGVLSAEASGASLVLDTEVDTGKKYGDKKVYAVLTKFFDSGAATSHWSTSGGSWFYDGIEANYIDFMLECKAFTYASSVFSFSNPGISFDKTSGAFSMSFSITADAYVYVEYTKPN